MRRRITGLETEYGVVGTRAEGELLRNDEVTHRLLAQLGGAPTVGQVNHYLDNGSRVYLDTGDHPEHAGPECGRWRDTLLYDRAGDEQLAGLADDAEARSGEGGLRLTVLKNNVNALGTVTYGCHENYLLERETSLEELMPLLSSALATRTVLTGAGTLVRDGESRRFELSQRAGHMVGTYGSPTTRHRNMVSDRDEPHAEKERWRRLHVIVGDSNLADVATALKVGTFHWALRVFEEGQDDETLHLRGPLRALHQVSEDTTLQAALVRRNGGTITALDHQELLLERSEKLHAAEGGVEGDTALLELWGETLGLLRTGWERAAGTLDWATKLMVLTRLQERKGLGWEDPKLKMVDLAYHDVRTGIARSLRERGALRTLVTTEEVERARTTPPTDTRAVVRGRFLMAARRARIAVAVSWGELRVSGSDPTDRILLPDPFDPTSAELEELLACERWQEEPPPAGTGTKGTAAVLWVPGTGGEVTVPARGTPRPSGLWDLR